MPIVSHITEQTTNADGSRHVVLRMFDQDGKEYMVSFFAAVGVDVTAVTTDRIAQMDTQLAESEFESLIGAA